MFAIDNFKINREVTNFFRAPVPIYDLLAKIACIALVFFIPLNEEKTRLLALILVVVFLASGGFLFRLRLLQKNPWAYVSLILYAIIFIGSLYGDNVRADVRFQLKAYAPILLSLVVISLLHQPFWRRIAFLAFMVAMLGTLIASYVHLFWNFPGARSTIEGSESSHHIFKSHITQNVMMSVFVLGCFLEALKSRSLKLKILLSALGCLGVVNILTMVAGRTGYISIIWVLLILVFSIRSSPHKWKIFFTGMLVTICIATSSPLLRDRISGVSTEVQLYVQSDEITSTGARLKYWEESVKLINEKPWTGYGTGSWKVQFCRIVNSEKWCEAWSTVHPHNQFLHFGVQLGVLGILVYFCYLAVPCIMAKYVSRDERAYIAGITGLLFFLSLVDVPLYIIDESYFFPVLMSIFLAGFRPRSFLTSELCV
jgi:O-antigen ligase